MQITETELAKSIRNFIIIIGLSFIFLYFAVPRPQVSIKNGYIYYNTTAYINGSQYNANYIINESQYICAFILYKNSSVIYQYDTLFPAQNKTALDQQIINLTSPNKKVCA